MFNMIAFLMQSACDIACGAWRATRSKRAARYRLLDDMRFLVSYVVHRDWDELMQSIINGKLPTQPPWPERTFPVSPSSAKITKPKRNRSQ